MKDHTSTPLSTSLGNVRVVFAAHSHGQPELLQQTSYYPGACPEQFGRMILNQQSYYSQNATENKFLYNSKLERSGNPDTSGELQDDQLAGNRLDWYDYGARFYDATLGRWHVVDPLAEKYYPISPYAYVANNPMIFIDPDGRDRKLVYNHRRRTITVKATYYHNIGSTHAARAGVSLFNNMKDVTYTDSEGNTWEVKFELSTTRSTDPQFAANNDPQGNSFVLKRTVSDPEGTMVAGLNRNQKHIEVSEEYREDLTPAHEIGHTLGVVDHSETGVMVPYSNHPGENKSITQENMNQIIEQGRGPVEHQRSLWETIKSYMGL